MKEPMYSQKSEKHAHWYFHQGIMNLFIIFCTMILCVGIISVILYNNRSTQTEFVHMVEENMGSFTNNQKINTLNKINDVKSTMQDLSILINQNDDVNFIDTYLLALNEENKDINYMYATADQLNSQQNQGQDAEAIKKLSKGDSVITDVFYSDRLNSFCIGIGMPVIKDSELIGAIRAIMNAKELISTSLYTAKQGQIVSSLLVKSNGDIIEVSSSSDKAWKGNLLQVLQAHHLEPSIYKNVNTILNQYNGNAEVIRLGVYQQNPYYLSIADLDYNDWNLVICLQADTPFQYSQVIIQDTTMSAIAIIVIILIICLILSIVFRKLQHKLTLEERKYLLLEQFSDTVLFDYNHPDDTLKCTSNATKLLRLHDLNQKDFLHSLNEKFIHPADQKDVEIMFTGKLASEEGEIRVRLIRPDKDSYFWASVKYKYMYEKDKFLSVIGRITDIDTLKQQEEHLIKQAEIDGLTGLYNKITTDRKIKEIMEEKRTGTIFMSDIDNFKQINDIYGHTVGDRTLQLVSIVLRQIGEADIYGRVGGDEMLIFTHKKLNRTQIDTSMEKLKEELHRQFEKEPYDVTLSIGTAEYPEDGIDYDALFQAADKAMYEAKKQEGCYLYYYHDIPSKP